MQTLKRGDVRELPAPIAADMKLIAADNKKAAGIEDYVKYDAGFCGMAAQLACVAVGLGSVVRGSFDAEKLTRALGEDATPLLCVTLGFAA